MANTEKSSLFYKKNDNILSSFQPHDSRILPAFRAGEYITVDNFSAVIFIPATTEVVAVPCRLIHTTPEKTMDYTRNP